MDNQVDEISLKDIADALLARRWLIVLMTVAFAIGAGAVAFLLPEKYEASIVLSPVDDGAGGKLGGAGALLSQFGGLAALGGINVGVSGKKAEAIATLQSHGLTENFIRDNNLLPILYADKWDAERKAWKEQEPDNVPTVWKAEKKFKKKILSVDEDKKTGLVTLTIEWTNAELAAQWAKDLVGRANRDLRAREIKQCQTNLAYLNDQLTKTSVVELQKAIYSLIEAEIKKVMIANGSDEFAFRVIDPPRVAEERSSPMRGLIMVVGLFLGFTLGVVLALSLPAHRNGLA